MVIRFLKFALVIALFIGVIAVAAYKYIEGYWESPLTLSDAFYDESITVYVNDGMSAYTLMRKLKERGVLSSIEKAKIAQRMMFPDFVLKRGDYALAPPFSPKELFEQLHSGVSIQYKTTFIDGKTLREVLNSESIQSGFDGVMLTDADLYALLKQEARDGMGDSVSAEGWFYPDTYHYARDDTLTSILRRAHEKMYAYLHEAWEGRDASLPYKSPYEALIMASLIERETGVVDERRTIAGVFVRRLQKRMRLQTDPTVIYGMGDNYQGNITRADLRRDTPYNTYTRHGLPPTPIALPSGAAIDAALHPEEGTALYFVAKGDGRHYFSDTLEEHREAVKRYQINQRRADYRSTPQ